MQLGYELKTGPKGNKRIFRFLLMLVLVEASLFEYVWCMLSQRKTWMLIAELVNNNEISNQGKECIVYETVVVMARGTTSSYLGS